MAPDPYLPDDKLPEMPLTEVEPRTDFESLLQEPPPAERVRQKEFERTDFQSLVANRNATVVPTPKRTWTDFLIDALTPLMVFTMVYAVVFFLLDVRYVVTAVHDANLRLVAFCFIMGVVALNRLVARDNSNESILYIFGLAGAVAMYTFSAQVYDVGSFAGMVTLTPGVATLINVVIVGFIWWLVNRLTHECCVDENKEAGNVGMLTGSLRGFQASVRRDRKVAPALPGEALILPQYELEAFDPVEGYTPKLIEEEPVRFSLADRLAKQHPGMSIFYFSVPVMAIFALGLRMVQHGGDRWILAGKFYMGVYSVSALMLLLLTSLGQLREYFRARKIAMPEGIGWFWIGLGMIMIMVVLIGAIQMPMPPLPPVAHVAEHIADPWDRGASTFQLIVDSKTPAEMLKQSLFIDYLKKVVLAILIVCGLYAGLKGLSEVTAWVGRNRARFPRFVVRFFDWLDRLLARLTQLPTFPERKRRVRIQKSIATSATYSSSLGDPATEGKMSTQQHVEHAYAALCALAYDLGVPRKTGQTPYEFIQAFPKRLQGLSEEATELTRLYVVAAYSPLEMDDRVRDRLRKFWTTYNRVRRSVLR